MKLSKIDEKLPRIAVSQDTIFPKLLELQVDQSMISFCESSLSHIFKFVIAPDIGEVESQPFMSLRKGNINC